MDLGSKSRRRAATAIVLVGATHFAFALDWGIVGQRSVAPDEISPRRVAAARQARFANGWHDYYPPLMFYAAAASHAASDALPGAAPEPEPTFRRRTLAMRTLSVAATVVTVLGLLALGRRIGLGWGTAVAALLWAASPTVTYYAKTGNVESLYLMWLVLALALLARALDEGSAVALVGAGALAALAAATKDQAAVYAVCAAGALLPLHEGLAGLQPARWTALRELGGRGLLAAGASSLAVYLYVLNVPFNPEGVRGHFAALREVARLAPEFEASVAGKLAQAWQAGVNLEFVLGLPAIGLALWGLLAIARDGERRRRHGFHLPAAIGYALFMWLALPRAYDRFLLPIALSAVLLAGEGADDLLARLRRRGWLVGAALVAILVYSGTRAAELDLRLRFDSRVTIREWIARDGGSAPTTWVLGKHDWAALAGRQVGLGEPPYFARELRRWAPRHLVAEAAWSRSLRWARVLRAAGYIEAHRDAGRIPARLSRHGRARTNLDKISPELVVYRRASPPAASGRGPAEGPR